MIAFFKIILFDPLYNTLIFLGYVIPGHDVGFAIIILTLIVKTALFPLQHKAYRTQKAMKALEPEMKEIKEVSDKEEQARKMMELYKKHGVNPFSSIALLLIQIPIILTLFYVFKTGFQLDVDNLYAFTPVPETVHSMFLGLIDVGSRSLPLALIVGLTQFFQMQLAMPPLPKKDGNEKSFSSDFARSMNIQMRYVMPVIIVFVSATLPAAVSIYWVTSNLFAIGHEVFVKKLAKNL